MKKKVIILSIACALLVVALAVTGTLAFFSKESEAVTNTFTAAGGLIDPPEEGEEPEFIIKEHNVVLQDDGSYELGENEVNSNSCKAYPSVNIPKDPFVRVDKKSEVPSYLYIEVVENDFNADVFSYEVDADNWCDLGIEGPQGGKVYAYCNGQSEAVKIADEFTNDNVYILVDNQIVVADFTEEQAEAMEEDDIKLDFYGYLAQASAGDSAEDAFVACFID